MKSPEYVPALEPVAGGLQELGSGKYAILRTDLETVWIRVLLPAPGLGYQWYMLNDNGYKLGDLKVQEIDGLGEVEKNLRNKLASVLESGNFPFTEWLFQSYSQRLMLTPFRKLKENLHPEND